MKRLPLRYLPALAAAFLLSGCLSIPAPAEITEARLCDARPTILEVDPHSHSMVAGVSAGPLSVKIVDSYRNAHAPVVGGAPISPSMLFLSGGSQHGAFGAGVLRNWAELRPDGLPTFKVVTGISTGAIMATHAFLDDTATIEDNYEIDREADILKRHVRSADLKSPIDIVTTLRKGAVGSLKPMRALLGEAITEDVLRRVSAEKPRRLLLVGAVDVELGQAAVFDMTDLAHRFATEADAGRRTVLRNCYLDIILASSSVPMAAPPTFIDNRMYIDGGARFGILAAELEAAANALTLTGTRSAAPRAGEEPFRPNLYVLINGDLKLEHDCQKVEAADCSNPGQLKGAHKSWSLTDLAGRSVSILIDQIYRFSNDRIHLMASENGFVARTMRIDDGLDDFPGTINFPNEPQDGLSCSDWKKRDAAVEKPLEFHARYMRCLILFGKDRLIRHRWQCLDPVPPSAVADPKYAAWKQVCFPTRRAAGSLP